ncbi:hypothetical protein ARTHRO9V_210357 [Arthrobacter sp. 9V]|nr:hypothetical protein ARTHRO9V_210357 [Arthrobacter sp. 9V]
MVGTLVGVTFTGWTIHTLAYMTLPAALGAGMADWPSGNSSSSTTIPPAHNHPYSRTLTHIITPSAERSFTIQENNHEPGTVD